MSKISVERLEHVTGVKCDGTDVLASGAGYPPVSELCAMTSYEVFTSDELVVTTGAGWLTVWLGIASVKHFCGVDHLRSYVDATYPVKTPDASSGIPGNPDAQTIEGDSANVLTSASNVLTSSLDTLPPPAGQENVVGTWVMMNKFRDGVIVTEPIWIRSEKDETR